MRSSCEASARKLRRWSSERARWAKADSIWASMPLRARPNRATSPVALGRLHPSGEVAGRDCVRLAAHVLQRTQPVTGSARS